MIISLIVAKDEKGGIGKNNQLPWHLHSDLQRFKKLTSGHHIVMGRRTYQTIGTPLPGRTMIIVTRNKRFFADGCIVVNSINEAIRIAKEHDETEIFIIGGGDLFAQTIHIANKIYITKVHADTNADVFFPMFDSSEWTTISCEEFPKNERDEFASDFQILIRNH